MENKNIILILLVVIVILALVLGVMFFNIGNAKEPTKVKITSKDKLYEGDKLSVQLTDLNKTPLSKQKVTVKITNKKGKEVVSEKVKTNSKGKAKVDLDLKKGKYNVGVVFEGDDNYTGDNATQKLTVKEVSTKSVSSSSNDYPKYNPDLGYYRSTGIGGDEWGVVELADGRQVVITGDGYYDYKGLDSEGYPITGNDNLLGHGGQGIS